MALYRIAVAAAALSLTAGLPAQSTDPDRDPSFSPTLRGCLARMDMNAFTNSQRLACATADMDRADGRLNRVYKQVMARLPADRRRALVLEERKWIDQRRSRCAIDRITARATANGPTPAYLRMLCLIDETDRRTAQLERIGARRR